ncbi:hypothetical protein D3C76_853900 [compost metagenome]
MTERMPAELFITGTELGIVTVTFAPWDKHTNNWADRPDELDCDCDCDCDCGQCAPFDFINNIPG